VVFCAVHCTLNSLDNRKADKAALLARCPGDSKCGRGADRDPSEARQRSLAENEYWLLQAGLQAAGMVQLGFGNQNSMVGRSGDGQNVAGSKTSAFWCHSHQNDNCR